MWVFKGVNNFRNLFFLVLFNFVEPSKIELLNTSSFFFFCICSVDVSDPSWTHCHECRNPSSEHAWGAGYWPARLPRTGNSSSPAWASYCCAKKIKGLLLFILRVYENSPVMGWVWFVEIHISYLSFAS